MLQNLRNYLLNFYNQDDYSAKNIIKAPPEYDRISFKKI